jgi:tetratricopeptide (TPR) repeat protein
MLCFYKLLYEKAVVLDNFFIEYRDPMFGLIILLCAIFVISFVNYWWGTYKSKEEKQGIEQFIKKFEIVSDEDEYKKLLKDYTIPAESLALLAHSYTKSGDYEKAIGLYLIVLERTKKREQKEYVLAELGKTYFRAGFLRRSADIFLESLKMHPRNHESLKFLSVTYEKLKEYDKAIEVLDSLEELGAKVINQRSYLKALSIIYNYKLDDLKKQNELRELAKTKTFLQRQLLEFSILINKPLNIEEFDSFDSKNLIDLIWYMDFNFMNLLASKDELTQEILSAKGLVDRHDKDFKYFEFEVLSKLQRAGFNKAALNFEYICNTCKHTFPMYFYRCPNCHSVAKAQINPLITRVNNEENISFQ